MIIDMQRFNNLVSDANMKFKVYLKDQALVQKILASQHLQVNEI